MAHYIFNFTKKNARKDQSLREQAAALLEARMWGIGDRTPNRDRLAPGDRILAYVGAPEQEFIGHAVVSSSVHEWTRDEVARYPGDWHAGVVFSDAHVWTHAASIQSVWQHTSAAENNPAARFFAGVLRITGDDFDRILAGVSQPGKAAAPDSHVTEAPTAPDVQVQADLAGRLYAHCCYVAAIVADQKAASLSEDATRAILINRLLEALGYTEFGDVEYGAAMPSGDIADYLVHYGGQPAAVVEAKRLGGELGPKQAAQVVKYASVTGVRWGLLTDGQHLRLYDCRIPQVSPENRLLFSVDLADLADREDFDVRLYPRLALLSKERLGDDAGLEQYAAMEAARDILTSGESDTVAALRTELTKKRLVQLNREQVADLVDRLLG